MCGQNISHLHWLLILKCICSSLWPLGTPTCKTKLCCKLCIVLGGFLQHKMDLKRDFEFRIVTFSTSFGKYGHFPHRFTYYFTITAILNFHHISPLSSMIYPSEYHQNIATGETSQAITSKAISTFINRQLSTIDNFNQ